MKSLERRVNQMDGMIKELLALTKKLTNKDKKSTEEEPAERLQDQALYFLEDEEKFELDSKVTLYCVFNGSFFLGMTSLDFKNKKKMLEKY